MKKNWLIVILLSAILLGSIALEEQRIASLSEKLNRLESVEEKYNQCQLNYLTLQDQYQSLNSSYYQLEKNYTYAKNLYQDCIDSPEVKYGKIASMTYQT